jgi:hypothetical protein
MNQRQFKIDSTTYISKALATQTRNEYIIIEKAVIVHTCITVCQHIFTTFIIGYK